MANELESEMTKQVDEISTEISNLEISYRVLKSLKQSNSSVVVDEILHRDIIELEQIMEFIYAILEYYLEKVKSV